MNWQDHIMAWAEVAKTLPKCAPVGTVEMRGNLRFLSTISMLTPDGTAQRRWELIAQDGYPLGIVFHVEK